MAEVFSTLSTRPNFTSMADSSRRTKRRERVQRAHDKSILFFLVVVVPLFLRFLFLLVPHPGGSPIGVLVSCLAA